MKKIITTFWFLSVVGVQAQLQTPIYSDYLMDNYYLMHPAMAGAQLQGIKTRATHRSQWQQIENAPSLQTFNVHSRLNEKSGIGAIFHRDSNGYHKRFGALLTYAHHLNFFRARSDTNQLSFGVSVGVLNGTHDQSSFSLASMTDPLVNGFETNTTGIHVDGGFSYNILGFYAHLSGKNLLFQGHDKADELVLKKPRVLIFNSGYFIPFSNRLSIEPSVLVYNMQYTSSLGYDINLKSHHSFNTLYSWFGLSYRAHLNANTHVKENRKEFLQRHKQFTIMAGLRAGIFSLSYAYTTSLENIHLDTFGGHQITIGIDVFGKKYYPVSVRGIL